MSGDIFSAKEAISAALTDMDRALDLTHSLTPIHEDAHSASISVHGSLEAATSGLSYFIDKVSLATESGATTVDEDRKSAIEAGKEVCVELGIAVAGLVTVAIKSEDIYNITSSESGILSSLKTIEKTAIQHLPANGSLLEILSWGIIDTLALPKMLNLYTEVANPREIYLSALNKRLKESVLVLMDSAAAQECTNALATVQGKITQNDLEQLSQMVEVTDAVKELFAFKIPEQQSAIQAKIQRVKDRMEGSLHTL